ncbi:MAG: hypothetical protein VXW29_05705, partial [SAR324 cluster bacterium]|nr:hypothetical protein [SAR324 cluster bacterium]
QIQGMQPLLRDYSAEIIHKNPSESNNKSASPDTMKAESEHNDDNIELVSSNEIELGIKNSARVQETLPDSKQRDFSLSKPQV